MTMITYFAVRIVIVIVIIDFRLSEVLARVHKYYVYSW